MGDLRGKPRYVVTILERAIKSRRLPFGIVFWFVHRHFDKVKSQRYAFGSWRDPGTNISYISINRLFVDCKSALSFAHRRRERFIYDLEADRPINVVEGLSALTGSPVGALTPIRIAHRG